MSIGHAHPFPRGGEEIDNGDDDYDCHMNARYLQLCESEILLAFLSLNSNHKIILPFVSPVATQASEG